MAGLEIVEIRDLKSFVDSYVTEVIARDAPTGGNTTSTGWNMGIGDGRTFNGAHNYAVYHHIRDELIFHCLITKEDTLGADALRINTHSRDALCLNPSTGWWREIQNTYGGTQRRLKMGQPNLSTGQQKVYCYNTNVTASGHYEIDALTGDPGATSLWPNLPDDFITSSNGTTGTEGYWEADDTNPEERPTTVIIFEGMTDTSDYTGETSASAGMLRGITSHPEGLALQTVERANFDGGTNTGRRWCWIDLDTGECVGVLGLPTNVNSTNSNTFAEPTLDGETFFWGHVQFVPDPDSTWAKPKGELVLSTSNAAAREKIGATIDDPAGSFTSLATRQYVAIHDFNPFELTTGPVRVHNRRTFLGLVDQPQEPIMNGGHNADNSGNAQDERALSVHYHPPTRSFFTWTSHPEVVNDDSADAPDLLDSRIIRWRRSFVVNRITQPTPDAAPAENTTIQLRTIAYTDLGQRASGAEVSFTLSRYSTRAESFDGTATGAGTYTVEADEIDDDNTLAVYEGDDVDNGGTLLVETTDYTVNYGTGVLTPVGSWPSDTIYVRYRHRNVKLTPAHGTLLTTGSTTDGDGNAFAFVEYGDNVDGELDVLEATA